MFRLGRNQSENNLNFRNCETCVENSFYICALAANDLWDNSSHDCAENHIIINYQLCIVSQLVQFPRSTVSVKRLHAERKLQLISSPTLFLSRDQTLLISKTLSLWWNDELRGSWRKSFGFDFISSFPEYFERDSLAVFSEPNNENP